MKEPRRATPQSVDALRVYLETEARHMLGLCVHYREMAEMRREAIAELRAFLDSAEGWNVAHLRGVLATEIGRVELDTAEWERRAVAAEEFAVENLGTEEFAQS